jgi:hypothetical protein
MARKKRVRRRRRRRARNYWKGNKRGHRRAARKGWAKRRKKVGKKFIRYKGKRTSWKGLVRKLGVKKASSTWRRSKKLCGPVRKSRRCYTKRRRR